MLKIKNEKEIRQFFYYYKTLENPESNIKELLNKIEEQSLFQFIRVADSETEGTDDKKITIYPNGIIIWSEMNTYNQIIEDCLTFIKKEGKKHPVLLQLIPKKNLEQEKIKEKIIQEQCTIGQYALEVSKMEREERKVRLQYQQWEGNFQKLKESKINDVLDRYQIQKTLFQLFKDEKYKRKMNIWEGIFRKIQQL